MVLFWYCSLWYSTRTVLVLYWYSAGIGLTLKLTLRSSGELALHKYLHWHAAGAMVLSWCSTGATLVLY